MKLKSIKALKVNSKESPRKIYLKKLRKNRQEEEHEDDPDKLYFLSSGCTPLNLAISGHKDKAYPVGRIINPKGEYSSGKTGFGIELINVAYYIEHLKKGKKVKVGFDDAEVAFDKEWAQSLGVPIDNEDFIEFIDPPSKTVEEWQYNLWKFINDNKDYDIIIYILDSIDALSDEGEQKFIDKKLKNMEKRKRKQEEDSDDNEKEDKEKGTFGASKAKSMSMFFRTLASKLKYTNCILFPISQIRDSLAKYGNKTNTSSGRAAGFYSTIRMDLSKGSKLFKNKSSVIPYGRTIPVVIEKNKIAGEGGHCEVDFLFKIGIDDIGSTIEFCGEYKGIPKNGGYYEWKGKKYYKYDLRKHLDHNKDEFEELRDIAQKTWDKIVKNSSIEFLPKWK